METLVRTLEIDLPKGQSAFLWGPRKTGKSTLLRSSFPESIVYDFLKTDLLLQLTRRPALLREQLLAQPTPSRTHPVILDEVQKVPQILNEVHWLIENEKRQFILCGSSFRKLKRGQANLLGGRAWRYELFPFITQEIPGFDLLRALNQGMIPEHYLATHSHSLKSLKAYVQDYLKEEVFSEGLTRNIPAFSRFFEAMGYSHGELTNYTAIARDSGIDSKTVKEYYQILVDTLLGRFVSPFKKKQNRQIITKAPKFYLFDVGVASILTGRRVNDRRGRDFEKAFEHFIFMELSAHSSYSGLDYNITFWRTKTGLEVDFILGNGEVAIEVKGGERVNRSSLRALKAFVEEHSPRHALVVANEQQERAVGGIRILPWKIFLERLWNGELIQ
jgi:predicted AAA+ superfamily ATPase